MWYAHRVGAATSAIPEFLYVAALEIFVVVILFKVVDNELLSLVSAVAMAVLCLGAGLTLQYRLFSPAVVVSVGLLLVAIIVCCDLAVRLGKQHSQIAVEPEWGASQHRVWQTGTENGRPQY